MGIADMFVDFVSSLSFGEVVEAEAPPAEESEDSSFAEETPDEEKSEEPEEEEAEAEEEEEEEEEEEPEDIMPKLIDDCANSKPCAPAKHHFDDCVERVTRNAEDADFKGPHEDCVEEFFHLQHCATQCAAPKLFRALK